MAQRRTGTGTSHTIAAQPSVDHGLDLLRHSVYEQRLAQATTRLEQERATMDAVLWQLRVLAGWIPATGTRLVRAAAGGFEMANILALARSFAAADGSAAPTTAPPARFYDMGSLSTAWPRLRTSANSRQLAARLLSSPWGDVWPRETSTAAPSSLRDTLTVAWITRLARVAPGAWPWAQGSASLRAARMLLVDQVSPAPHFLHLVRPVIGTAWQRASSLTTLTDTLPRGIRPLLHDLDGPQDLWRAEARLTSRIEEDGFRMLRGSSPGPEVVLGAITVIALDAWRVRAALAAAEAGGATLTVDAREVLDALA